MQSGALVSNKRALDDSSVGTVDAMDKTVKQLHNEHHKKLKAQLDACEREMEKFVKPAELNQVQRHVEEKGRLLAFYEDWWKDCVETREEMMKELVEGQLQMKTRHEQEQQELKAISITQLWGDYPELMELWRKWSQLLDQHGDIVPIN